MTPEELARLLENADAAIARGASLAQVGKRFREVSGVSFTEARKQVARAAAPEPRSRISRGMAAITSAAHGFTAGQLPNIATAHAARAAGQVAAAGGDTDDVDIAGTRDRVRGDVADAREQFPIQSIAAEAAGGLIGAAATAPLTVPTGAPAAIARAGLATRSAAGAAGGAGIGASFAHGEGEDVATGAAIGGAAGALSAPVSAALGSSARRLAAWWRGAPTGEELGKAARKAGGASRSYREATEAADDLRRAAQQGYRELEERFADGINNPDLTRSLRTTFSRHTAAISKEVAEGKRLPTFEEVQSIRNRMQGLREAARRAGRTDRVKSLTKELNDLDRILTEAIPEFGPVNTAYRGAIQVKEGLVTGRRLITKSAADVEKALAEAGSPEAQRAIREGFVAELVARVEKRQDAPAFLKALADAGPETKRVFGHIFGEEAAAELLELARRGQPNAFKRWLDRHPAAFYGSAGAAGLELGRRGIGLLTDD